MRRLVALASLLVGACGTPPPPATPAPEPAPVASARADAAEEDDFPGRGPTAAERRHLARLLREAERIRGLTFAEPVSFRIQDRETITGFVRAELEEEDLAQARDLYVAIGLLDPDVDVRELLVAVLGEQIVGYYDPERDRMVVREDTMRSIGGGAGSEGATVVVHELVHALQDQRLGLGLRYEEERSIDGENAFASLVEGDATLAMLGQLPLFAGDVRPELLRSALLASSTGQTELDGAPPVVRVPLLSRYADGVYFCATRFQEGGWPAVNAAYERLPVSTEQILHPEAYERGEVPVAIDLTAYDGIAPGWTVLEEETLGELEMGIWLAADGDRDEAAAAGWGGDRLRVYRSGGGLAYLWLSAWDDEAEAAEAEAAARRARPEGTVERRGPWLLATRGLPASATDAALAVFRAADP
jgi:hypothetical protein